MYRLAQLLRHQGCHRHAVAEARVEHTEGVAHNAEALRPAPGLVAAQSVGCPFVRVGIVQGSAFLNDLQSIA